MAEILDKLPHSPQMAALLVSEDWRVRELARHFQKVCDSHNDATALLAESRAQVAALSEQLEHDRTLVANCITNAAKEIESRSWLIDGRGPYEWDDDRYREEFGWAGEAFRAALEPMRKVAADWTSCPMNSVAVAQARINLKQRIAALEAELAAAKQDTERLDWLDEMPIMERMEHRIVQEDGSYPTWTVKRTWQRAHTRGTIRDAIDVARAPESTEGKDKDA